MLSQPVSFRAHQELCGSRNIMQTYPAFWAGLSTYASSSLAKPTHGCPVHLGPETSEFPIYQEGELFQTVGFLMDTSSPRLCLLQQPSFRSVSTLPLLCSTSSSPLS